MQSLQCKWMAMNAPSNAWPFALHKNLNDQANKRNGV